MKNCAIIKGTLQEDVRSLAGVPSDVNIIEQTIRDNREKYIDEI